MGETHLWIPQKSYQANTKTPPRLRWSHASYCRAWRQEYQAACRREQGEEGGYAPPPAAQGAQAQAGKHRPKDPGRPTAQGAPAAQAGQGQDSREGRQHWAAPERSFPLQPVKVKRQVQQPRLTPNCQGPARRKPLSHHHLRRHELPHHKPWGVSYHHLKLCLLLHCVQSCHWYLVNWIYYIFSRPRLSQGLLYKHLCYW